MNSDKFTQMTTYPINKLIIRLSIPTVIMMLISSMYNMADTFFVGSLGTSATAAVGITFSLQAIIQAIGFFFGQGTGNYISRALGAKRYDASEKMAATGFFTALIIGLLLAIFGYIFLIPLIKLLGATPTIIPYAKDYITYILIGTPFVICSFTLNNILRFQGDAFVAMIGMVSGAILNIILDPIFIFTFKMGIKGASFATMLCQMLTLVLLFTLNQRNPNGIKIRPTKFLPILRIYKEIFRGGVPSLLRQTLLSISTLLLNHVAGNFGDAVIAAISIVNRIVMFSGAVMLGIGQGFQPVCGFNYGAAKYDRVKKAFYFCLKSTTSLLFVLAILFFIFAPSVIAFFRSDDKLVIQIGAEALRIYCLIFPLIGWIVLVNMMLQTIGRSFAASFLAIIRQGLFTVPLLFTMVPFLNVRGIELTTPIAELLTFMVSLPLGLKVLKKLSDRNLEPLPLKKKIPINLPDL